MAKTKSKAIVLLGILLIIIGISCNEFLISSFFYQKQPLDGTALLIVRVIYIAFLGAGIFVLLNRKKSFLIAPSKNILLLFTTIFIVYLAFELMFSMFIGNMSMGLARFIPFPYRIVSQSSKDGKLPQNYIAIFGDSHAIGAGDGYLDADPTGRDAFHTAHDIHKALKQDVISFGSSGASSLSAMIDIPINNYRILCHKYDLGKPEKILVYFYAGNDIADNLNDLKYRNPNYFDYTGTEELTYPQFSKYIEEEIIAPEKFEGWSGKFVGLGFVKTIILNLFKPQFAENKESDSENSNFQDNQQYNQAIQGNQIVTLPLRLQAPALELNSKEWEQGLKTFSYSLRYMQSYFKGSEIYLVYLPSVLSCYDFQGEVSAQVIDNRKEVYSAEELVMKSDSLVSYVKSECEKLTINFVDTKEALRNRSGETFIHGPKDWKHYNEIGYELLAKEIIAAIK